MSFAKNIGKNIGKNISETLSSKYSQKCLDHVKQSAANALKTTLKRVINKTAETTGDLIGNKTPHEITNVSRTSPHNSLEMVKNENDKEIPKERYISTEERQKTIADLNIIV